MGWSPWLPRPRGAIPALAFLHGLAHRLRNIRGKAFPGSGLHCHVGLCVRSRVLGLHPQVGPLGVVEKYPEWLKNVGLKHIKGSAIPGPGFVDMLAHSEWLRNTPSG